ncbi:MAG: universal stress protein [Francisellaceae bacterium]|jgi:nucleotide-binding universal stress UspA family protein|nr:universal stress protein [Francisellaceae bacterium]MBT6206699.1 universal stress protein [Francisellaceae bacterium]MBT6538109.1 universal stress protein [Francisellaceae bacterium]
MSKIIGCIDGSVYADSVSYYSAWLHERTGLPIELLHVVAPHSEIVVRGDLSGQIGVSSNSNLLEKLTKIDEEHGKLEQSKGKLMLDHAQQELTNKGIEALQAKQLRGSVVATIEENEKDAQVLVIGKRGEHHQYSQNNLGSNLEKIARRIHKPLFITTEQIKPIEKFLVCYDGSPSANKAINYIAKSSMLKGIECHLLKVDEATESACKLLEEAKSKLEDVGFKVISSLQQGKLIDVVMHEYIHTHVIDLLVMGSYGHSKIRSFFLGSTTTTLIQKTDIPLLLFRKDI